MVECNGGLGAAPFPVPGVYVFRTVIGIILALFAACFVAIVIEELFLAGKRRRAMERRVREEQGRNETTMERQCD